MSIFSSAVHSAFSRHDDARSVRPNLGFILAILSLLILAMVSGYVVVSGGAGIGIWDDVILVASVGLFLILILGKVGERIASSIQEHSGSHHEDDRT